MLAQVRDECVAGLDAFRAVIVREAFEWIGTPYVTCGYVKGKDGAIDCAMLLVGVFAAVGRLPADYDPRPYNPDWHLHQTEERYLAGLVQWVKPVKTGAPGDIALYRFGRTASHGAIIVSDDFIIHAHKHAGQVELCERRLMEPHFDSYWSAFA